jgi:ribosome-associated toxin RatA of RatAB toxin-antitoxin module
VNNRAIGTVLAMLTCIKAAAQAPSTWVDDQTVQQQLTSGDVAVQISFDGDQSSMRVRAAVKINASPDAIWHVLTDCERSATFIPGVKRCRRIETAPDNSWETFEQEIKYSWYMPPVTCVIRASYRRPLQIDFKRVSGDLKEEEGHWMLIPRAPNDTLVEYDLHVDPGFWIPRVLLRHSLRSELPAALAAVRSHAEHPTDPQ